MQKKTDKKTTLALPAPSVYAGSSSVQILDVKLVGANNQIERLKKQYLKHPSQKDTTNKMHRIANNIASKNQYHIRLLGNDNGKNVILKQLYHRER